MGQRRPLAWGRLFAALACFFVAVGATGLAAGEPPPRSATPEEVAGLFRWWDGLGYPDLAKPPFVRVAYGFWFRRQGQEKEAVYEHAFLLADGAAEFRVFTTDLRTLTYKKTPPGTPEWDRVGHDPVDFEMFVREGVAAMRKVDHPVEYGWHDRSGLDPFGAHRWLHPDQSWRLLVLARACAARGIEDLPRALVDLALREDSGAYRGRKEKAPSGGPFDAMKAGIAWEAAVVALARMADERATLADVRDEYARWVRGFPDAEGAEDRKADLAILERMLAEEKARGSKPAPPPSDPPTAEALDDLVHRLRDMQGERMAGYEGVRPEKGAGQSSAYARLVRYGPVAVPRLIAALDDRTFTRSVLTHFSAKGQFRDWTTSYRVSDAAIDALDEIAGGAFRRPEGGAWDLHEEDAETRKAVRARVDAWWGRLKEKGEAGVLAEIVEAGRESSPAAAKSLAERTPDRALAAIKAGIAHAERMWVAAHLLEVVENLKDDASTAYLRETLASATSPRLRLIAARALFDRNLPEGVPAMAREWTHPSAPERAPESPPGMDLPTDPGFRGDLLRFLVASSSAEAYRALGEGLSRQPAGMRFFVVSAFLRAPGAAGATGTGSGPGAVVDGGPPPALSAQARDALETLLGERLSDIDAAEGVGMSMGDVNVDTRVGVAAAWALSLAMPDVYRFDPRAARKEREAQRRAVEVLWRSRRGLPPLPPLIEKRAPPRVPDAEMAPLLDAVLAAADDAARARAAEAVAAKGIGALPALVARLKGVPNDHPARSTLDTVAARLASTITEVVVPPASAKPDVAFSALLAGLEGKPLDGARFLSLVLAVTRNTPEGSTGVRLEALRADDLSGVTLTVTLTSELAGPNGSGGGWEHMGPGIQVGEEDQGVSYGTMAHDFGQDEKAWKDGVDAVEKAFLSPPETPVLMRFSVVRERLAGK